MHICLVSYEYSGLTYSGGIGVYVSAAASGLAAAGCDVTVLTGGEGEARTPHAGVVVQSVGTSIRAKFPHAALERFRWLHHSTPVDVIEGPDFLAEAYPIHQAFPDIPYFVKLHTPYEMVWRLNQRNDLRTRVYRTARALCRRAFLRGSVPPEPNDAVFQLERRNAETATRLVAPSLAVLRASAELWDQPPERFSRVPCFFCPPPGLVDLPVERHSKTVLYFGRLEVRKGVHVLAKAMPRVWRACHGAHFRFVGADCAFCSGSKTMSQVIRAFAHGRPDQVEILPAVPREELYRLLESADICVFPSLWESFGLVILEAMVAGKAVVCTAGTGMAELVGQGKYGILVPPGDHRALAAAIVDLLQDPDKCERYGREARDHVLEFWRSERIAALQIADYESEIVAARGNP